MNDLVNISESTKWNELLGSSTKDMKLLYGLEIVENILERENLDWRVRFVGSGGYKHLVQLLTSCDLNNHFETRLGIATIDLLLRAVSFFTTNDEKSGDDINFKLVLHKLFGILGSRIEDVTQQQSENLDILLYLTRRNQRIWTRMLTVRKRREQTVGHLSYRVRSDRSWLASLEMRLYCLHCMVLKRSVLRSCLHCFTHRETCASGGSIGTLENVFQS